MSDVEVIDAPRELVQVSAISGLDASTPADVMAEVRNRIDAQLAAIKAIDMMHRETEAEWIKKNGPLVVGSGITRRLVTEKKVNNPDKKATLEKLFDACGGDFEKVAETLSADAFKAGASRGILGDDFDRYFTETVKFVPETKKPKKSVQTVNERFLQTIIARKEASRAAE